jgi:hypothetical protein
MVEFEARFWKVVDFESSPLAAQLDLPHLRQKVRVTPETPRKLLGDIPNVAQIL